MINIVLLRQKLPSRQRMFNDIRALTSYLCFESWDALMAFMLQSFEPIPPAGKRWLHRDQKQGEKSN
jgi:hypothetical protein